LLAWNQRNDKYDDDFTNSITHKEMRKECDD